MGLYGFISGEVKAWPPSSLPFPFFLPLPGHGLYPSRVVTLSLLLLPPADLFALLPFFPPSRITFGFRHALPPVTHRGIRVTVFPPSFSSCFSVRPFPVSTLVVWGLISPFSIPATRTDLYNDFRTLISPSVFFRFPSLAGSKGTTRRAGATTPAESLRLFSLKIGGISLPPPHSLTDVLASKTSRFHLAPRP